VIAFIKPKTIFSTLRHKTNVAIEVAIVKFEQHLIFVIVFT